MKYLTSFLLAIATLTACQSDDTEKPQTERGTYLKEKGQCGETWGDDFLAYEEENALAAAEGKLASHNVEYDRISIDSTGLIAICVTCHDCPSGWSYVVTAGAEYEQTLLKLGFREE